MSRGKWAVLAGAGAALLVLLFLWVGSKSPEELRLTLRWLAPRGLDLAFLLLAGGAVLCLSEVRESFPSRRLLYPLAMGLLALVLVRVLPPRTHRIYYDEDIYQNVAQNIVWTGRAQMCNEGTLEAGTYRCEASEYNKEPNALPFLLSLVFRVTGVEEHWAHALNHVVFALGAFAVFWLTAMLFESEAAGFGASLVYVLIPQNLLWNATVAAEPGAAAFAAFGLSAWLLFCRRPSWRTAMFAASALAFAAQFRPESGMVLGVAAFVLLVSSRELLSKPVLWGAALLTLLLLAPHLLHLWAVRDEPWGSEQAGKFSWRVVETNTRTNVAYHVGGDDFPPLFTGLALLGLFYPRRRRETLCLLVWFLLFFGIFIPFYAGSYRYGADVRFSLVSAAPLAALAGGGLAWLASLLRRVAPATPRLTVAPYFLVIYAFSAYLPLTRAIGRESWASRADHAAALRMTAELPPDSIVLTHNPGMIHVMGRSAAQTSVATYQPQRVDELFRRHPGGVYFHYNFWCNVDDPVQNEFCNHVLKTYGTRVVLEESAGFYRYVLYRLLPRSEPPPPPLPPPGD